MAESRVGNRDREQRILPWMADSRTMHGAVVEDAYMDVSGRTAQETKSSSYREAEVTLERLVR